MSWKTVMPARSSATAWFGLTRQHAGSWPADLPFSQEQVHRPAPPNMRPLAAAVLDKGFIVATGL